MTAYVVSAWTKRGAVVNTQYNQTSLLRTMELILDLPPTNRMDAAGMPMFDCFSDTPDFTPFTAVMNQVPLDQLNPSSRKISDSQMRKDAYISRPSAAQERRPMPEDLFNPILWHATKGSRTHCLDRAMEVVEMINN